MTRRGSSDDAGGLDNARGVVHAFRCAWETADESALNALLDPLVSAVVDGGGRVPAPLVPIHGIAYVGRSIGEVVQRFPRLEIREQSVNGAPGLVVRLDGRVVGVAVFGIHSDRIRDIWLVLNPDKLSSWNS